MKRAITSNRLRFTIAIILYVIVLLAYGFWDYDNRQDEIMDNIDAELYNSAVALKYILPDDFHDRAVDNNSISVKEDKDIAGKLTKFTKETSLKYTYTIIKQQNRLFFIASDIIANPETKRGTFYFYPYENADKSFLSAFSKKEPSYKTVSDQWGTVRTVMVPEQSPGGIKYLACADYDIGYVDNILRLNLLRSISTIIFFLLLSVPIILLYIKQQGKHLAAIKKSEEKYRKLVSRISDVIVIMDEKGVIQYKSPNITEQFGWRPEELVGRHGLTTVHDDDQERIGRELESLIQQVGKRVNVEYSYVCKDGSTKPVELTAVNLLDDPDIKGILANYKDISDRKKPEEELKQSEEKYRTMIERSNDMIWTLDADGNFTFFNKQTEDVTGLKLNEWIGKSFAPLLLEEDSPMIMEIFQKGLKGISSHYDLRFKKQSNEILTISVNTAPMWKEGKVTGIVSFGRDITDQKKTEKEKERLKEQLQQSQKMESVGTLAGGIAHDFNNILSGILGYSQLAKIHAANNSKVLGYIEQLNAASERARDLVKQILAFSRQSGSEKGPVDVGIIVKEALKLLRASIPTTIDISHNVATGLGTVQANQTQIHQVVMNLCTNAAHAMEAKGGRLLVELKANTVEHTGTAACQEAEPGTYLNLSISDNGHGISPEHISRIFDPYFTTKEKGKGSGMGLATVYGIVKDHGGYISVKSEVGIGTSFTLLLPLQESETITGIEDTQPPPSGNETILLVDDEKAIVDVGKELLENLGYTVEARASSQDALAAFRARFNKYDLVITDMAMPKMNGLQLSEKILAISPNIPIILCTGFSEKLDAKSASKAGIRRVVMKPVTLKDLARTVRSVLDNSSTAN